MLPRRRAILGVAFALLAVAALAGAQAALAVFSATAVGGPLTVATSTLSPAKSVVPTQLSCHVGKAPEIAVTWSATSSSYATSYTVERATATVGPYTALGSVAVGKTSYTDSSGSLGYSTTYYYRVTAVYRSWSATSTSASVKTLSKSCL
jgi:hypothetical protein